MYTHSLSFPLGPAFPSEDATVDKGPRMFLPDALRDGSSWKGPCHTSPSTRVQSLGPKVARTNSTKLSPDLQMPPPPTHTPRTHMHRVKIHFKRFLKDTSQKLTGRVSWGKCSGDPRVSLPTSNDSKSLCLLFFLPKALRVSAKGSPS